MHDDGACAACVACSCCLYIYCIYNTYMYVYSIGTAICLVMPLPKNIQPCNGASLSSRCNRKPHKTLFVWKCRACQNTIVYHYFFHQDCKQQEIFGVKNVFGQTHIPKLVKYGVDACRFPKFYPIMSP